MVMRTNEFQNDGPRVKFERPLEVRVMTIDGTWCGESFLIDVSDTEAQIEPGLRSVSPKNGNISIIRQRLSVISLLDCSNWECRDRASTAKRRH